MNAFRTGLAILLAAAVGGLPPAAGRRSAAAMGADPDPFEALRAGRVRGAIANVPGPPPSAGTAPALVLVPGRGSSPVAPDATYRLEGVPVGTPIRASLVPLDCRAAAAGTARPWIGGQPVVLDPGASAPGASDIGDPGTPPEPVLSVDAFGPGGARTVDLGVVGETRGLDARGRSPLGDPRGREAVFGSPAIRVESSNPAVASVSPSGFVRAQSPGAAWIRVAGDGECARVLVRVDLAFDRDGDGMPDSFELAYGFEMGDPSDADLDADGDGLSNRREFELGADPRNRDTDGDLLDDGLEVLVWGTLSLHPDTDGDLASDGAEVAQGKNPLDPNDKPGPAYVPSLKANRSISATAVRAAVSVTEHLYIATADQRLFSYRIDPVNYFLILQDQEVLSGDLKDVSVNADGARTFVAAGSAGLHVVDSSNPAALSLRQTVSGLGTTIGVATAGDRVLVTSDLAFWVLRPGPGGDLERAGSLALIGGTRLAAFGDLAYVALSGANRLAVVDVSDPARPAELQRFAMPEASPRLRDLVALGEHVYVAHGSAGIVAISARDPRDLRVVDTTARILPGVGFDAIARAGHVLAGRASTETEKARLFRLEDDGRMELLGEVATNPGGAIQLVGNQNYAVSLGTSSFGVSEILASGDRAGIAPTGELVPLSGAGPFAPGAEIVVWARARDDKYVDWVEFFLDGRRVATDGIAPFRWRHELSPARPAPYSFEIRAVARDLQGNAGLLGPLWFRVEPDLDGDRIPDGEDPDQDGDGVPDLEEQYPGADGWVSDPRRVDTDGDGILDGEEVVAGEDGYVTDPGSPDTDGDGLTDFEEVFVCGTDPTRADADGDGILDAGEDPDGDGLACAEELSRGTDPRRPDTEGDGLPDGVEVSLGLDPLRADTDGDGVPDGEEDFDGDGLSNGAEVARGVDPFRADTDGDGFDDGTEIGLGADPARRTDFSSMSLTFRSKTVTVWAPLTVGSLALENSVLTVPAAEGSQVRPLDLTVLGLLSIDSASRIDVSRKGSPGLSAGDPSAGGSHGGLGGPSPGSDRAGSPPVSGSFKRPGLPGGGGSARPGGPRGGAGGGVAILRADRLVLHGAIAADGEGGPGVAGAGAGGTVAIEVSRLEGSGSVRADGGSSVAAAGEQPGAGGGGRIAIRAGSASGFDFSRVSARGGATLPGPEVPAAAGGAGTAYLEVGMGPGRLVVDNAGRAQDGCATVVRDAVSGTVARAGEDWIERLEGDFPAEAVGLALDPDAEDGVAEAFEIAAVEGPRAYVEPAILGRARPGAKFSGAVRLGGLEVRGKGALRCEVPVALAAGSGIEAEDAFVDLAGIDAPDGTSAAVRVSSSVLVLRGPAVAGSVALEGSVLTVPEPSAARAYALEMRVEGPFEIDAASRVDLDGKGYVGGGRGGNASRRGQTADGAIPGAVGGRTGGSHGGLGGYQADGPGLGVLVQGQYDDTSNPRRPGGGGSGKLDGDDLGFNGGGLARIAAGTLVVDGAISADGDGRQRPGAAGTGGAGAGGGIWIEVGALRGAGEIRADGGFADGEVGAGAGGGGRIAIRYSSRAEFSGAVHAYGGGLLPERTKVDSVGGAGTVYWKSRDQRYGDLVIDNGGRRQSGARTRFRGVGSGTTLHLEPTALTVATPSFLTSDTGLEGSWVVVAGATGTPFPIVRNTATELFTDPAAGDMTRVGSAGAAYQGALVLDNLLVTGWASATTGGDLVIIATGSVTVESGGSLSAPPIVRW